MAELKPFRAAVAGVFGLGYVYVRRLATAVAVVGLTFAPIAIMGWTRLILTPVAIYFLAIYLLGILLLGTIHPALIAAKNRNAEPKSYNRWWFYLGWWLVFGVAANVLVKNRASLLGYEPYRIPSGSMTPTLESGDFITVDAWRYRSKSPLAGDVVVYQPDPSSDIEYVMRIVALPGDEVEMRGGRLFRNSEPAPEEYLDASLRVGGIDFGPIRLRESEYFVLGDNRGNSRDSRYHGPVPLSRISGRVESIWFSTFDSGRFPARVLGGT
jgi:signal peptidase I